MEPLIETIETLAPAAPATADPAPAATPARPSAAEIEAWLTAELSRALELPAAELDPDAPFDRFGMDSVTAIALTESLERWLGRGLDPTLLYDYPSIGQLARHLSEGSPA